ncbi:MAG TPA: FAD-binding oxidoreductase [Gammaproteobacteria bacterium]|nr:FAD-binding oxidoreductase [Gammaproteobacteria bacterium]
MPLPPNVSRRDFGDALRAFAAAVGDEWVFSSDEDLALYRDAYSPLREEPDERVASAAVAPATVEQVQAILRAANRYRVPLYPISTGRNLAYGGAAPVLSGSVVLDLKRMNRVLEVDEANAYALVEPGVSYFDLYRHIQDRGMKLMLDVPTPGWGSAIGNALEHGVGLSPLRDHSAAQCGLEVVLADGSLLRTGMGAMPNAATWQQFKYGIGPHIDGLFSQSNFGVVTKMGFWLLPEPEAVRGLRVIAARHDDVAPLIATLANLVYSGVIDSTFSLRSPVLHGTRDADFDALVAAPDGGAAADWDRYAAARELSFWQLDLSFYGPEALVDLRWAHTLERFRALAGVRFANAPTYRFPMSAAEREQVRDKQLLGIPSLEGFVADGADGHVDFSVVVPMSGAAVLEALKVLGRVFAESQVDVGMGALTSFHARTLTFISSFPTRRDDREANRRMREAYGRALDVATAHGWGQYRAHAAFMDRAVAAYSFNDGALARFHARLKDAVDPNGILAAGRYGIWPRDGGGG